MGMQDKKQSNSQKRGSATVTQHRSVKKTPRGSGDRASELSAVVKEKWDSIVEEKGKQITQYLESQKKNSALKKRMIFEEEIIGSDSAELIRKYLHIPDSGGHYESFIRNRLTRELAGALCAITPHRRHMDTLYELVHADTGILMLAEQMTDAASNGDTGSAMQQMAYLKKKTENMQKVPLLIEDAERDALVFPLDREAVSKLKADIIRLQCLEESLLFRDAKGRASPEKKRAFEYGILHAADWQTVARIVRKSIQDRPMLNLYPALKNLEDERGEDK